MNAELHSDTALRHPLSPSADVKSAVLEELHRLLESAEFRGSRRSSVLLSYLVQHTFAGTTDRIKERTIGVELFGRETSYDTGQDSIVRVAANDVRRRLNEHYERLGAAAPAVRISLPPGCYIPEFHGLNEPAIAVLAASIPAPVVEAAPARAVHRFPFSYAALACVLAVLCLYLGFQNLQLQSRIPGSVLPAMLPWSMLGDPGRRISIVPSDGSFGVMQMILGREVHLADYSSGAWISTAKSEGLAASELARMPLVNVAETALMSKIGDLLRTSGYTATIQPPRSVQISDFKSDHPMVLLGSAFANRWEELVDERTNFQIVFDLAVGRQVCRNISPQPKEEAVYVPTARTGDTGSAYATVSLLPNLTRGAYVLIIAGTNMEGVEAAGELVTDLPRLAGILRGRGIDPARKVEQLELLIRLECLTKSARRSEVIAHRVK